jgi:hydroxypyruvate isomerase
VQINYGNVFKHIHERASKEGKEFVIGMEHGNSIKGKEGEAALIAAYRAVDPA